MGFKKKHIDPVSRLRIGLDAYYNQGIYGCITGLSHRHLVSRWFIYECRNLVRDFAAFTDSVSPHPSSALNVQSDLSLTDAILNLYLHCETSISGIQRTVWDLFGRDISVGQISEILNGIGSQLSDTDEISSVRLCIISDEIFSNGRPVLVTVDSESCYLLQVKEVSHRDKETWGICWLEIIGSDGSVERVSADMGSGLVGGISLVFPDAVYQSDLLHVLMPLASLVWQFERTACSAIDREYEALTKSEHSKYGKTQSKYEALYISRSDESLALIECYDDYFYLFGELQQVLQVVDEEKGELRMKSAVRGEIEAILELMESIGDEKLTERVRKFRKHLDALLQYFDQSAIADQQLGDQIPDVSIRRELIRLYSWKTALRSAVGKERKRLKADIECWETILCDWLSTERFKTLYQMVDKALSVIIRSSSMVENANSRLRRFFDSARGQVNQNRLNLIRFYLNHKVFTRGPRKGKSPGQMFHGLEKPIHWLTALKAQLNG